MKRYVVFILAFFVSFFTVYAQPVLQDKCRGVILDEMLPEMKVIDSVRLRVYYISTTVVDTAQHLQGEEKTVLDIGDRIVKYYSGLYKDLVYLYSNNCSVIDVLSTVGYRKNPDTWFSSIYEATYLNMSVGRITTTGRIGFNDFLYEQDIPDIDWQIEDSIKVMYGYKVQKATCIYKGRHYIAWFTSEIPAPYGPWEFQGLPGLIVSVCDTDNYYTFTLESVLTPRNDVILYPDYKYINTTRQKYLNLKKQIEADFGYYFNIFRGQSEMEIIMPENYIPKKLGNDFIELE